IVADHMHDELVGPDQALALLRAREQGSLAHRGAELDEFPLLRMQHNAVDLAVLLQPLLDRHERCGLAQLLDVGAVEYFVGQGSCSSATLPSMPFASAASICS